MQETFINFQTIETIPPDEVVLGYCLGYREGKYGFSYSLIVADSKTQRIMEVLPLFENKGNILKIGKIHYVSWCHLNDKSLPFNINFQQ